MAASNSGAAFADGPKPQAKIQVQLEDSKSSTKVGDADAEDTKNTKFVVPYARIGVKGSQGKWSYNTRFSLNKVDDSSAKLSTVNKNVDYAYISYKIFEDLTLN